MQILRRHTALGVSGGGQGASPGVSPAVQCFTGVICGLRKESVRVPASRQNGKADDIICR